MLEARQVQVQAFTITIQWIPQLGQFAVKWPEGLDEIAKLGMLETAKLALLQERLQPEDKPKIVAAPPGLKL